MPPRKGRSCLQEKGGRASKKRKLLASPSPPPLLFKTIFPPQSKLADPDIASDATESQRLARAAAELQPAVDAYRAYRAAETALAEARELAAESAGDAEMLAGLETSAALLPGVAADWLARHGLKLDAAVSLEVPFDQLLARIHSRVECPECRWSGQRDQLTHDGKCPVCGGFAGPRADDSEENFRSRHAEFVSLTQPVIGYYREAGLLSACEATAPESEVAARLLQLFPARPA